MWIIEVLPRCALKFFNLAWFYLHTFGESMFSPGLPFHFLWKTLFPYSDLLDSASSHTAFHSSCHLAFWAHFPWDSRNVCDTVIFYSSILWISRICLKSSPVVTFLIPSKAVPTNSLAWFKCRLFLLISPSNQTFGRMFFTVYKSNGSKNLFKRHQWDCEVSSSKTHSNPPPPPTPSATSLQPNMNRFCC